jgi:spore coat polysaccharide biosynthesis protein SpsF
MKVIAIVQARMGSTRLPGKVLMDLGGQPVLSRVVLRLRRAATLAEVVVATTESWKDESVVQLCEDRCVKVFRGSEEDVLDRYYRAASFYGCDAVVRITSDCPLVDAELVDHVVREFLEKKADYASNVLVRTYPRGLDAEVFTLSALEKVWRLADRPHQREHVTPLFYQRPDLFRLAHTRGEKDYSRYRWTLDTPDDLCLIRTIYGHFDNRDDFSWRQAIDLMEQIPELHSINAHVLQKPLQESVSV